MVNNILNLKIGSNLGVVSLCCGSLSLIVKPWKASAIKIIDNLLKLKIDPYLGVVSFYCKPAICVIFGIA